jgi:hypothetical protein
VTEPRKWSIQCRKNGEKTRDNYGDWQVQQKAQELIIMLQKLIT